MSTCITGRGSVRNHMNLLIVDDERLTREGLLESIDFKSLGIDNIETAEDGQAGLKVSETFEPDVVLTDVRMPKMDGIRMMQGVQERYPDSAVIFMSGFSDKEYLKAAIKLRAVSYVEKPIDTDELSEAIKDALSQVRQRRSARNNMTATRRSSEFSLAYRLLKAADNSGAGEDITEDSFDFDIKAYNNCFSVIIRCYDPVIPLTEEEGGKLSQLLDPVTSQFKLKRIYTINNPLFVFHFFSERELSEVQTGHLGRSLTERLKDMLKSFHIVIGRQVKGFRELSHSYNTAVINLQQCFFMPDNNCLLYRHISGKTEFKSLNSSDRFSAFKKLLADHKRSEAASFLEGLLEEFTGNDYILPNQAREFYYRLLNLLIEAGTDKKLPRDNYLPGSDLWERVSACHSVYELHDMILTGTEAFFTGLDMSRTESAVVYSIKTYISENYGSIDLSIMAISDHVKLSSSYVCTLFKSETGITLNQYITEYRLGRAKELLSDPRNRIADIAEAVGYSDSNYFSKIFRKSFGLSPSEFRESL